MCPEETKVGRRIEYIDIAKALGIILVIAGHAVSSDTEIKRILYSFHMPLFFMLSGMLLKPKATYDYVTWKTLAVKKLKMLMLPYFIWALVYSSFSFKHFAFIAYGTRETLICAGSLTSLWFLPVMFLAFLYAETVLAVSSKAPKYRTAAVIAGIAACFLIGFILPHNGTYGNPWGLDVAFIAAAFMLLGMLVRRGTDQINKPAFMAAAAVIACAAFICVVRFSSSPVGYVLMANGEYGNPLVFLVNAVTGSMLVIMISRLISTLLRKTGLLQWIGSRTLGIFVVHKPIVELGRSITKKAGISYDNPGIVIIITLITLAVSGVIVLLIEHIIPEIIGLKNKTDKKRH